MADLDELILQPPQGAHGAVVGDGLRWDFFKWDQETFWPQWLIAYEIAVPGAQGTAIWGEALWGIDVWSEVDWYDLTPYVAGAQIVIGSGPDAERPDPGQVYLTLNNLDPFPFSPWSDEPFVSPGYMGAGTLLRISLHDPVFGLWAPLVGVIIEDWQESYETSVSGVGYVTITGIEVTTLVGRVNEIALTSVVGLDDTPAQRIQRLLDAANFRYGFQSTSTSTEPLQSTDMALNRLAECYLVADSVDAVFRTARAGYALLEDKDVARVGYPGSEWSADGFALAHEGGAPNAEGLTEFDPVAELHPAGSFPDSLNVAPNSSVELSNPCSTTGGAVMSWSTAQAHSGVRSTQVTWSGTQELRFPVSVAMGGGANYTAFVWVYVAPGDPLVGQTMHFGSRTASGPFGWFPATIVSGWKRYGLYVPGSGDPAQTITHLLITCPAARTGTMYVDDWMVIPDLSLAAWEPADGEPFYTGGMQWYVTAAATYQGLDLEVGDTLVVLNDPSETMLTPATADWGLIKGTTAYRVPYVDSSLVVANNDDALINTTVLSCEGGTEQTTQDVPMAERYDPRYYERANLQYKVANQVTAAAHISDRVLARSHTYRPYSCRLDIGNTRAVLDFIANADISLLVDVLTPYVIFRDVAISQIVHNIKPLQDSSEWTVDLMFSPSVTYSWAKRLETP